MLSNLPARNEIPIRCRAFEPGGSDLRCDVEVRCSEAIAIEAFQPSQKSPQSRTGV
ncbi:hypothetical protein CKA32_004224 [Geitlerinema sp. FC II]|nr:hypothetical protein CKA32_004224 [Geitlerinema sp. FC II]